MSQVSQGVDSNVRVELRVDRREDFVRERLLGERVTVVRGA
jgi:hypothetical protein